MMKPKTGLITASLLGLADSMGLRVPQPGKRFETVTHTDPKKRRKRKAQKAARKRNRC